MSRALQMILLVGLSLAAIGSSLCRAGSAVAYQLDAAHSGGTTFKQNFTPPFQRLWLRDLGGPVSYPLIAKGMVFVTVGNANDSGSVLYALRLKGGKTAWQQPIAGTYAWSGTAYDDGMVFVVNYDGLLQAFAARSGAFLWGVQLPDQYAFSAAPTARKGHVYIGGAGHGGTLYSVDESDGAVEWTANVENGDVSAPTIGSGGGYVSYPCQYYKFDLASGRFLWHDDFGCEGGGGATTAYYDGLLYVRDQGNDFVLFADSGRVVGSFGSDTIPAFFRRANSNKYMVVLVNHELYCVSVPDGNVVWSFAGDGQLDSNPIIVNNVVLEGSHGGNLYALDGVTGSLLWSDDLVAPITQSGEGSTGRPWTGLGAADGVLVVPATNRIAAYASQ